MTERHWTAEAVHESFAQARQARPAYAAMLPFFEELYTLEESAAVSAAPAPMLIRDDLGAAQAAGGLPLVDRSWFTADWTGALDLLRRYCDLAMSSTPLLKTAADRLRGEIAAPEKNIHPAGEALIKNDPQGLEAAAGGMGLGSGVLGFFLYHSLWPGIARHVDLLRDKVDAQTWAGGSCPVCGSPPFLSLLDAEGRRDLVCSFCRHQWRSKRIFCPFCENSDNATLGYFFNEEEKEYRVNACQACKRYIKTVDLRVLQRPCYPPLESIVSAHLDLHARQEGYQDLTPPWFAL